MKRIIAFDNADKPYGFLSNLYPAPMDFCGRDAIVRHFSNAECAYQFQKFKDLRVAEWAVAAPKARFVAILGHGLFAYDIAPNWKRNKLAIMNAVVHAKFRQNPRLGRKLLATGDAILCENTTDKFWREHLGEILMRTREAAKQWEIRI